MSGDWTSPPAFPEQLLRLLLDAAADAAVFVLDAAGRVSGWDAAAERLFGYSERDILGQPYSRFFAPEDAGRGDPERELRTAAAAGRFTGDRWEVRKDGTWFWAAGVLTALRDAGGAPAGYVRVARDRTEQRLAGQLLEKRERRFRALIENGWDAVVLLAADGAVVYASPSTARVLGYPPAEFVGRKALELVHPDDLPRINEMFSGLLAAAGRTLTSSFRYRHADGGWRWLEGVGTNLLHEPSVRAVAANFRDVTPQKEAEQVRSQLAAIVESSRDAIIAKDLNGIVTSWNKAAERLYGYKAAEVVGKPLSLLIPPGQPDELPGLLERLKRGEVIDHYETVRVRKDGTRLEVALSISPVRDAAGRIVGAAKIVRDATARRKAERRQHLLAESGAVLAASLDDQAVLDGVARLVVPALADFCVIHVQAEGGEVRQAAAAHVDPSKEGLLRELARVYRPDAYPESLAGRVLRWGRSELAPEFPPTAGTARPPERLLQIVDQLAPRSGVFAPLAARGRTLGVISLIASESGRRYDASDLEFAEELARRVALAVDNARLYHEVQEADRRKDQWIAMLAHELRNPLAPMLHGLHLLGRSPGDRRAVERAGAMMERQVRQLARLVDDLLDVSRIARGKVRLRGERLDLARLVRTTAGDHGPTLAGAGLTLTVEAPETPVWTTGDAARLTQVLSNLLDNAAKFTDRGGRVEVTLRAAPPPHPPPPAGGGQTCANPPPPAGGGQGGGGGLAELRVRDTGVGIEPEMLPRLFEPLHQADRSLDRTKGGLGLGLALVKGLTELHGGTVRATSEGPGRGTEFVVRLPLEAEPAALSELVHSGGVALAERERRRILVVEDNRDAADTLRMLLELSGHEVRVAYTGPDGVRLAEEWRPGVVVSDIGLPGLDGFGVARALRANPATAAARLIAVTGYGSDEDRRQARESGFDHLLTKPADPGALQRLLVG